MKVLEGKGISVRFGGLQALKNVSIHVKSNEILGLIGPNGAGKSTLINVISGVIRPNSGKVYYNGKDITGWKPYEITKLGIARTFQIVRPFPNLTVLQNVAVGALYGKLNIRSLEKASAVARECLELVGLKEKMDEKASSLNEIEKRRLELARVIATGAEVLLLDEIAAGSTPTEAEEIIDIVRKLKREHKKTIIIVEHVMRVVMGVSDRITVLHMGEKIAEGSPKEVANNRRVIEVYLGE